MKKIILLPIEPLEERYSAQWLKWFNNKLIDAFNENKIGGYQIITPNPISDKIRDGSFLDVCATNDYKMKQLSNVCQLAYAGGLTDDHVVFLMDAWFPGLECLQYIRDGLGLKFKIVGCLFAGTWDPYDFLTQKGMGYWAKGLEESWFRIVDKFFLATKFHKDLILKSRDVDPKKLIVTGHPMFYERTPKSYYDKKNIVIFPHRLDPEKNPQIFDEVALYESDEVWSFIKTKEVTKTKEEYFNLLDDARISVSFADQETFGFAMIESLFANCLPIVPDKLSYSELYSADFKYSSMREFFQILNSMMFCCLDYYKIAETNKKMIQKICDNAIPNMIEECLK